MTCRERIAMCRMIEKMQAMNCEKTENGTMVYRDHNGDVMFEAKMTLKDKEA